MSNVGIGNFWLKLEFGIYVKIGIRIRIWIFLLNFKIQEKCLTNLNFRTNFKIVERDKCFIFQIWDKC